MTEWERQKREIFSYNLFYSGIKWRHNTQGLHNHGYGVVGHFLRITEAKENVTPEPDFVLYNGDTVLFVEIKSGENINDSHLTQMSEYTELDLEDVENFLNNTRLVKHDSATVSSFDHCIVYFNTFLEKCKNEWPNCKEKLVELSDETVVLSQERGEKLQISDGSFSDSNLNAILSNGVELPPATDKTIYLTENVEHEALCYSICNDLVITNLQDGEFVLTPSQVRSFYGREMSIGKVRTCLDYLLEIGACRDVPDEDNQYRFVKADIKNIVGVESSLKQQSVEDYLDDQDHQQTGLSDFI